MNPSATTTPAVLSAWQPLARFSSTWLFDGVSSLATALVALGASVLLRRLLPKEERQRGRLTNAALSLAIVLALCRVGLAATGLETSIAARAVDLLVTFLVATGVAGTAVMLVLEIVPARIGFGFPTILRDIAQSLVFLIIVFGVLSQSGFDPSKLFAASAVVTAVVGLALQTTLSNLLAGLQLHLDRTLSVNDWIQVGQRVGRIAQIRWRSTTLSTTDGDNITLPNSQILANDVYNYSRPVPQHRVWIRISFRYQYPPNRVRRVLIEAARETPGVLDRPAPDCLPVEFGDSSIVYALRVWIDKFWQKSDIVGEILTRAWYATSRAGLEIASPIRTILQASSDDGESGELPDWEIAERILAINRLDLFLPLEAPEKHDLALQMKRVPFAAGEIIIRQGETGDSLYVIAEGQVRVALQKDAADRTLARMGPGSFFGEMSLMTGEPRTATVAALTDVVCFVINRASFQQILAGRPDIAAEMSALLAVRQAAIKKKGGELSAAIARANETQKMLDRIKAFFDME